MQEEQGTKKLVEMLKGQDTITVSDGLNWRTKGRFLSRDLPTILNLAGDSIQGVSARYEGKVIVKEYYESLKGYKLSKRWEIKPSGDEYVLSLDGSKNSGKTWNSPFKDNLMYIAHERDLKDLVRGDMK